MRSTVRGGWCVLSLLTLWGWGLPSQSLAAPLEAAQEKGNGLLLLLEGWSLSPRNVNLDYAFVDVGSLTGGGEVASLEHGRELVPRFYAGWRFGETGRTQLGMTFWEYDDTADAAVEEDPLNVGPLLASPAFLAFSKVDSAVASSRLRATQIDGGVRWRHPLGESAVLRFDAELRFFRYERRVQVSYSRDFGQLRELFINSATDSSGIGPRFAVSYEHHFGSRFGVGGQLGLALPVGESQTLSRQEFLVDGGFDSATQAEEPGTTRAFLQLDAELGIDVRLAGRWYATVSYAFQQWSGVEQEYRFVDVAAQSAAVLVERDAVFEGFLVGIRYGF